MAPRARALADAERLVGTGRSPLRSLGEKAVGALPPFVGSDERGATQAVDGLLLRAPEALEKGVEGRAVEAAKAVVEAAARDRVEHETGHVADDVDGPCALRQFSSWL